jgi:transposase
VFDSRTLRSTPESGRRAGWDGHKRVRGSKLHLAVDTLGHRLALHVTPANADDRAAVAKLAEAVHEATGESVELAYVDQGYTGDHAAEAAGAHGIALEVVKLPEAKHGFVLLPRRWVVERSFAWMARFRRLARDYERLPGILAGLHLVAFVILLLHRAADFALVPEHLSVYQTSPELREREAFEEEFDGAPDAAREPGEPSTGELGRLTIRSFFSAGIGLLA